MTREEAIKIIDNLHLIGCGHNQHEDDIKINIALDMAIEALRASTDGDSISRQGVINLIRREVFWCDNLIDEIKSFPSADRPQGEWKPFDLTWGRNVYFCTACKESTEVPTVNGQPSYNYCPNCGAMMHKGGDDK